MDNRFFYPGRGYTRRKRSPQERRNLAKIFFGYLLFVLAGMLFTLILLLALR